MPRVVSEHVFVSSVRMCRAGESAQYVNTPPHSTL